MPDLRTNILASALGGAWMGALTIAITPLQLKLLGYEAYGLLGLITALQVALAALDLGLSATTTQMVASGRGIGMQTLRSAVGSVITVYWAIAAVLTAVLWHSAEWIAENWLQPADLPPDVVVSSVRLIAVYVALRWPVAVYASVIAGLERLEVLNAIKSSAVSVRLLVGIGVLLISPSLEHFLWWYTLSALLELAVFVIACHRLMPALSYRPTFSFTAFGGLWRFSVAMNLIALSAVLLTQLDRILISKLLSLEALGFYTLAYSTAHGFTLLQNSINAASLPAFARVQGPSERVELTRKYLMTSELMGFCYALPCFALLFFGHDILRLWIDDRAADGAFYALVLLEIGFFCNAMVSGAYIVAVACGRPSIPLKVNALGVAIYVPLLYWLIGAFGLAGAALAWIVLNLYYFGSLVRTVHRQILDVPLLEWFRRCSAPFILTGGISFGGMKIISDMVTFDGVVWLALCIAAICYVAIGYRLLSSELAASFAGAMRAYSYLLTRKSP